MIDTKTVKTNNAIFVREWNCHYHEACLPSDAPCKGSVTFDMNNRANIARMPYVVCAACKQLLILGNGRIEQVQGKYPHWTLPGMSHVEHLADFAVGKLTIEGDKWYRIIHVFIQPDAPGSSSSKIIALCEPIEDPQPKIGGKISLDAGATMAGRIVELGTENAALKQLIRDMHRQLHIALPIAATINGDNANANKWYDKRQEIDTHVKSLLGEEK